VTWGGVVMVVVVLVMQAGTDPGRGVQDSRIQSMAQDDYMAVLGSRGAGPESGGRTAGAPWQSGATRARRTVPFPCYAPGAPICGPDAQMCPVLQDGTPQTMYWVFEGPPGVAVPTENQWVYVGRLCLTPAQAAQQAGEGAPVLTAEQFRRLPLPAGVVHVQPGNGRTLVNVPTNVYVEARTVTLPTTVLGRAVQVRATPVGYAWTFGDGAHLDTHDPGAPYPDLRTTHTYLAPGARRVTLATTYRGEYSVDGAPWLPVDGTATVTGPAVALTVVATRSELVADPLPT